MIRRERKVRAIAMAAQIRSPQDSAPTPVNTRRQAKKIPTGEGLGIFNWWRRRELNPRPQALYSQDYMLSLVIWVSPRTRQPAGWCLASRFDGSTRLSDQTMQRG